MKICFKIAGYTYCFYIPVIVNPWPWWGPDPGPERQGPRPEPWITREGSEVVWAKDLQVLASIDALTQHLSSDAQKAVHSGLSQALSHVKSQLPEGAEIHQAQR